MEFVTIQELARMTGVSTATIRLDIKSGRLPVADQGKRGRGNPTRIRIEDLAAADRAQYRQLARRFSESGTLQPLAEEQETERFSVNELALRTGLSPQVVRKDIIDGKLKAEGGGRRGSPYYIPAENLANAERIEYRRLAESQRSTGDEMLEKLQSEVCLLKKEVERLKERLQAFESQKAASQTAAASQTNAANGGRDLANGDAQIAHSANGKPGRIVEVEIDSVVLPHIFQGYYVSDEKLKRLKTKVQNGEPLDCIQIRRLDDGSYVLRRGIAQYHVARELGLTSLPAYVESSEE